MKVRVFDVQVKKIDRAKNSDLIKKNYRVKLEVQLQFSVYFYFQEVLKNRTTQCTRVWKLKTGRTRLL
jgi:hypothetical protein